MKIKTALTFGALLLLTGCAATAPKSATYFLEMDRMEEAKTAGTAGLRILVDNFSARDAYKGKSVVASPAPYQLTKRANAEWAENAGTLVNSAVQDYLAARCEKVLPPEWKNKADYDLTLLVHLDALCQCKREKNWFAVLRLSYEVLPKKGGEAVLSGRFDKAQPLPDGDLGNYAEAQGGLVKEWLDALLARLSGRPE
jgi:uncharacterized lipoprotein YmbA